METLCIFLLASLFVPSFGMAQDPAGVLLDADRDFARVTSEQGLKGWLSYFAEDAAIFPRGKPVIRGIDPIRKYYEEAGFDPRILSWEPEFADISASGELGYTYGYWTIRQPGSEDSETQRKGKYTTIWKKQPDGNWRVVVDIGTE